MLNLLAETLRSRVGETLTPAVAAEIFGRVAHGAEHPLYIGDIEPLVVGEYLYSAERLSAVLTEIQPLHAAHWAERSSTIFQGEFRPDYASAIAKEVHGDLLLCTVRHHGELIGSLMCYLHRSTHTQERVAHENSLEIVREMLATEDSMFVRQDHRNGTVGVRLFDYFEQALHTIGVTETRFSTNVTNRVNNLLLRRHYEHVLNVYTKRLVPHVHVNPRT